MQYNKTFPILVIIISIAVGAGCKKNNYGNGSPNPGGKVTVTTIAGDGSDAFADGPALSAKFHSPFDVAVAPDGTIYVSDFNDHRIRKISGGQVTTYAGNDNYGIVNGDLGQSQYKNPYRIAVDGNGNLYTLDQVDPRIRKISTADYVSTYAGSDQPGFLNGAALMAQFAVNAGGIATDAQGNVYIGDSFNNRIRRINQATGVSTYAGSGGVGFVNGDTAIAQFRYPDGIALDQQGNLYLVDGGNFVIRKVTPTGVVSTFAGSGTRGTRDGDAGTAEFYDIGDIVVDNQGNLYVSDGNVVRKITAQGVVSTIAGSSPGYVDGDGAVAKFKGIGGLGIDAQGNVYVADINNNRIRKISFQ